MSENWKIQVSPKLTDGTLINLRAETPEEAEALFQWALDKADAIIKTVGAFGAVNNVASGLGGQVVQQETSQQGSWSQQGSGQGSGASASAPSATGYGGPQQGPAQSGEGKRCAHGEMTYREGVGKGSGKPYKAYFCPAPRGTNQCAPEFVR